PINKTPSSVALWRCARQRCQILGHCKSFCCRERLGCERMPAFELGGSQRRQLQGGVQRRAVIAEEHPAREQRREHHDAVDGNPLIALERSRGLGGAKTAITFAE